MENVHPLLSGEPIVIDYSCEFSPIYLDSDKQEYLNINNLWTAGKTKGRIVPRVDDIVSDRNTGFYWVTHVSADGIATLAKWNPFQNNESEVDNVFIGRSRTQEANTLFIDPDVYPYRITVDGRVSIKGSQYKSCKIFLGTDTSEHGIVISRWMVDDEITGTDIPLELVKIENTTNLTEKSPKPAYTNRELKEGEFVTLVASGDVSVGTTEIPLIVRRSSVLRGGDVRKKRITGISIKSPYLSKHDSNVIDFPVKRTFDSLDVMGVVHYENGDAEPLPIDGKRFRLAGLSMARGTIPGKTENLTLSYQLEDNEDALDSLTSGTLRITRPYKIRFVAQVKQYNVKLFAMPVWVLATHSWRIKYFMYSLDRKTMVDVTDHVYSSGINSHNFDGKDYTNVQHLSVAVQLKDVFPDYPSFKHVQEFEISLKGPWKSSKYPYFMSYSLSGEPVVGEQTQIKLFENTDKPYIQVNDGFRHQFEWLSAMYYNTIPMCDGDIEHEAPRPTHFRVTTSEGDELGYWDISRWDDDLNIDTMRADDNTFFVHFVKETENQDLHLACISVGAIRIGTPEKPVIRKQPAISNNIRIGEEFKLTCKADGIPVLQYFWHWRSLKDDTEGSLPVSSSPDLTLTGSAEMDSRYYFCIVRNDHGEANTSNSTVYIVTPAS